MIVFICIISIWDIVCPLLRLCWWSVSVKWYPDCWKTWLASEKVIWSWVRGVWRQESRIQSGRSGVKNNQNNRQAGELENKIKYKNESSSSEHWASLSSTYMLWTIHYDPSHPTSGRQPVKGQVLTSQCDSSKLSLNESQGSSVGCLGPQVTSTGGPPKSLYDRNFIIIFALST